VKHLLYTFAMGAFAHGKRVEREAGRRFAAACFFLETIAIDFQRKGHYDLSQAAREVLSQFRYYGSATAVCKLYGATDSQLTAGAISGQTPVRNTGVNPQQLSIIEDFVAGE